MSEPWTVEYGNGDESHEGQWFDVGPARVQFSYRVTPEKRAEMARAAAMIAAAPDLLAALRDLYALADSEFGNACRNGYFPDVAPLLSAAKAALSRAEEIPPCV